MRINPSAAPTLAKLCRRSCKRTPPELAAARTRCQTFSIAALALSAPPTDISLAAIRALAEKQVAAWTAAVQGEATR